MDKKVDESLFYDGGGETAGAEAPEEDSAVAQGTRSESQPKPEDMEAAAKLIILADEKEVLKTQTRTPFEEHEHVPDRAVAATSSDGNESATVVKDPPANDPQPDTEAPRVEVQVTASFQPRPPVRDVRPGAFRVPGPDADQADDDDFTLSPPSVADSPTVASNRTLAVTAELFDADEESRVINQRVQQGLQQAREREAVAEVVPERDEAPSSEKESWYTSVCIRRHKILGLITVVLVAAAIILWVVSAKAMPVSISGATFYQSFYIENQREFNEAEQSLFCQNMIGYTEDFGGDSLVGTSCQIISQEHDFIYQGQWMEVKYDLSYQSNHKDVKSYPALFRDYVNGDLERLTTDLRNAGLAVYRSLVAYFDTSTPTTATRNAPLPTDFPSPIRRGPSQVTASTSPPVTSNPTTGHSTYRSAFSPSTSQIDLRQPIVLPPSEGMSPTIESFPPVTSQPPTIRPTITPLPTGIPSASPSVEPTFRLESQARTVFNQRFQIGNQREFNDTEKVVFCQNMAEYTDDFGGRDDGRVNTTCRILSQRLQIIGGNRQLREKNAAKKMNRALQGVVFNQIEYVMPYRSNHTNVTWYPTLFQNYVNEDLDRLTTDLQNAGLAVTNSFLAFNNIATMAPTMIPRPTITPWPTVAPSMRPSALTMAPSAPFVRPPNIEPETAAPSTLFQYQSLTKPSKKGPLQASAVTITVIAGLSATAFALSVYWRRRKRVTD